MSAHLHPRERLCNEQELRLRQSVSEWMDNDLTTWETVRILQSVLAGTIDQLTKYEIRIERHGDTDTPGGLEA